MAGGRRVLRCLSTWPAMLREPNFGHVPDLWQCWMSHADGRLPFPPQGALGQGVSLRAFPLQTVCFELRLLQLHGLR